jgi:RHS repeat-associated protein
LRTAVNLIKIFVAAKGGIGGFGKCVTDYSYFFKKSTNLFSEKRFMRLCKLCLLVLGLLYFSLLATSQQQSKSAAWNHPIFKAIENKAVNLVTFSHDSTDNYFIPLAVLNKTTARLYYINTFGFVFDSLSVGPVLLKELMTKRKNAFEIYTSLVTTECLSELAEVKTNIRENKLNLANLGSKQNYFNYATLKNTASSFEQLTLLADIEKEVWQHHQLLNLVLKEKTDTAFLQKKLSYTFFEPCKVKLHGKNQIDSVVFTASNRFSRIGKAVLQPATAIIYLLNRQQETIDSFSVKEDKLKELTSEKLDVFALYNMWLEWQLENATKQINQLTRTTKLAKLDIQSLTEDQINRLDTLVRIAYYTERKIFYATLPDKDLLLINLLEQSKRITRKNWIVGTKQWEEVPMPSVPMAGSTLSTFTRGEKEYFLTDHRGNVMATVSDRKVQVDNNNDGIVDYYVADVVTATDYAPFGSLLAGRTYRNNSQQLKYGYNGKENDNEVKGEGNQQDYGMRISDPRLGRFLSVDPLTKDYPMLTPYQYASNSPITNIDLDGLEGLVATGTSQPFSNDSRPIGMIITVQDAVKINKRIIVSAVKAIYSEALPKKLIEHYAYGEGKSYQLNTTEMSKTNTLYTGLQGIVPTDEKKFQNLISNAKAGDKIKLGEGYSIQGAAGTGGTLGRYTIELSGEIVFDKKDKDKWTFSGKMRFFDVWDFETKPVSKSDLERSDWGDTQTELARKYLPGTAFSIISDWVDIKQLSTDLSFDWFKGKPKYSDGKQNEISNDIKKAQD